VDHRTDIWAFGVVLCEMVTGRSPFKGETVTDTLAAVLSKDLDLDVVPERFRELVRRCLYRDVRKRLGWIGEARGMLEAPAERKLATPRRWWIIPAIAAGMLFTGIAGWLLRSPKPVEAPLRAFSFTPESLSSTDYLRRAVISPNGKHIAYAAGNKLWIRDLESERARPVDGSEDAVGPFWSPDSGTVAFVAGRN
jgi:serine/threonine-protein kinase